jgi:hypothetical protein
MSQRRRHASSSFGLFTDQSQKFKNRARQSSSAQPSQPKPTQAKLNGREREYKIYHKFIHPLLSSAWMVFNVSA